MIYYKREKTNKSIVVMLHKNMADKSSVQHKQTSRPAPLHYRRASEFSLVSLLLVMEKSLLRECDILIWNDEISPAATTSFTESKQNFNV